MSALKKLCSGLTPAQIQQLAEIPREFGFSKSQSQKIVQGLIGSFAGWGNLNTVTAAQALLQSLSEKNRFTLLNALLNTVAKMKGFANLEDAL